MLRGCSSSRALKGLTPCVLSPLLNPPTRRGEMEGVCAESGCEPEEVAYDEPNPRGNAVAMGIVPREPLNLPVPRVRVDREYETRTRR